MDRNDNKVLAYVGFYSLVTGSTLMDFAGLPYSSLIVHTKFVILKALTSVHTATCNLIMKLNYQGLEHISMVP